MIALFQDQIAEHQTLAEHYRELAAQREKLAQSLLAIEQEASGVFQAIANITQKIQDSKAIATLKFALLDLFDGRSDDGGGNKPTEPTPSPEPTNPFGGIEDEDELEDEEEAESEDSQEEELEIVPDEEIVDFEDVSEEDAGEELISHPDNSAIAYIPSDDGKLSAFIGFGTKAVATSWEKFIEPMAAIELSDRPAFMEGYKYELRCYGLSMAQVTRLATQDFTKKHIVRVEEIGTAKPPESLYRRQNLIIQMGTRISRLLTPSEVFEATTIPDKDGIFFAKSLLSGDRQLFNLDDVSIVSDVLPVDFKPKFATVLLTQCPHKGGKFRIISEGEGGINLETSSGTYWYRRDCVEIHDEEIEAIAQPTEPTQPESDTHSILSVGDIVQVLSDRYPQFVNHVCTVTEITNGLPPILVKGVRGIKPYYRNELKMISKAPVLAEEKKELAAAGTEFDF